MWLHSKKFLCTHSFPQPFIRLTLLAQENDKYRCNCGWKKRGSVVIFERQQLKLLFFDRQQKGKEMTQFTYCACGATLAGGGWRGCRGDRWAEGLCGRSRSLARVEKVSASVFDCRYCLISSISGFVIRSMYVLEAN